jgi:tryptophan-rich sensory protein
MMELASRGQLRAGLLRWALVLVPGILLLGLISGVLAGGGPASPWFASLNKPAAYPAPEVFGIVWVLLYILMGLALAMVVSARGARQRNRAIGLFAAQLAINLAWSPLFFGAHQITAALILIVVLDIAVIATILVFRLVRPVAALLLVPYLAWILFATYLNGAFLAANPENGRTAPAGAVTRIQF